MPISPEQFKQILAKSSKLCSEEARNTPQRGGEVGYDSYNMQNSQPELDYSSPYGDLDESYDAVPGQYQYASPYDAPISQNAIRESRMPEAIKQSMLNEVIDVSSADPNRSVLDQVMKDMPARKPVQERSARAVPQAVDYSLIKAIVEECIDRKLDEFRKTSLNEGTLKTIGLADGKIRIVDNKGNLFSAQLKHQGNINEK